VNASDEVRDFYERMPYPPPIANLDEQRALYQNPVRRRALFHRMFPTERPNPRQEILIAGCGTSQAARHALREPDARVTAIDISETSLRHTRDLQRAHQLENLLERGEKSLGVIEAVSSTQLQICRVITDGITTTVIEGEAAQSVPQRNAFEDADRAIHVPAHFPGRGLRNRTRARGRRGTGLTERHISSCGDGAATQQRQH